MLGVELLLTFEEIIILNFLREEEGSTIEEINIKLFPMSIGDSTPFLNRLIELGLVLYGTKRKSFVYISIDWNTGKLPHGFEIISETLFKIKNEIGPNQHGLNYIESIVDSTDLGLVFKYWQSVFQTKKQMTVEDKRAIKNMLKEYEIAVVKKAILGLSYSDFHNGENPQGVKYQALRHVSKNFEMCIQLQENHG
jgi:hypothetical protein